MTDIVIIFMRCSAFVLHVYSCLLYFFNGNELLRFILFVINMFSCKWHNVVMRIIVFKPEYSDASAHGLEAKGASKRSGFFIIYDG